MHFNVYQYRKFSAFFTAFSPYIYWYQKKCWNGERLWIYLCVKAIIDHCVTLSMMFLVFKKHDDKGRLCISHWCVCVLCLHVLNRWATVCLSAHLLYLSSICSTFTKADSKHPSICCSGPEEISCLHPFITHPDRQTESWHSRLCSSLGSCPSLYLSLSLSLSPSFSQSWRVWQCSKLSDGYQRRLEKCGEMWNVGQALSKIGAY